MSMSTSNLLNLQKKIETSEGVFRLAFVVLSLSRFQGMPAVVCQLALYVLAFSDQPWDKYNRKFPEKIAEKI